MLEQVYVFKVDNQTKFVTTQKYKYKCLFVKLDLNKDKSWPNVSQGCHKGLL